MRAGPKIWTEAKLAERIKLGLGCGRGADYLPAIRVQDFSSRGVQTRIPSKALGRTVHTHSYLERGLYLVKEFMGNLLEYREQFPMDRAITLGVAKKLDIKHPVYPQSRAPVVMTLDALITERDARGNPFTEGWDVKPHAHLTDPRVLEKLSLHKGYCAYGGFSHRIFTERSVSPIVLRNIDWLRASRPVEGELEIVAGLFTSHTDTVLDELQSGRFKLSLSDYGHSYDRRNALPRGTGLRIVKNLAWTRAVDLDLTIDRIELQAVPRPRSITRETCIEEAV